MTGQTPDLSGGGSSPVMTRERMAVLLATHRDGLLNDTLPFWINHCVDRAYGGFMFALDRDGTIVDTDKGMWQQGRFTWLLGLFG